MSHAATNTVPVTQCHQDQQRLHAAEHGGNPQSASTTMRRRQKPDKNVTTSKVMAAVMDCMSAPVKELLLKDPPLRMALVIDDTTLNDHTISAIRNPVSTCCVDSLTVLHHRTVVRFEEETEETKFQNKKDRFLRDADAWLERNNVHKHETFDILQGHEGLEEILRCDSVDAVYIFVPAEMQLKYVLQALKAGKHVLLKDPVSTPCEDFVEQMKHAVKAGKFIQFSTMFVHHFHSQSFMDCVCSSTTFGEIQAVDTILMINEKDLEQHLNISFPLTAGQGCVRRLARYALLITTLMLKSNKNKPTRAMIVDSDTDKQSGQPTTAKCVIEFSGGVTLRCKVGYCTSATRQVLTVKSASNKYATMTDYVIPHPDGLATYRVYDKQLDESTGRWEVVQGECLDVPTGSPMNVSLWREFHRLCKSVDTSGGWNTSTVDAQRLTESSLQTKTVLKALDQSFAEGGGGKWVDVEEQPSSFY